MIGMTLPQDAAKWYQTGFVRVSTIGGTPDAYMPLEQPVVSVDCYAVNGSWTRSPQSPSGTPGTFNPSNKPPWDRATQLAQRIRAGALAAQYSGSARQVVPGPAGYAAATVASAYLLTQPRPLYGDAASYARVHLELMMRWIPQTGS